MSLLVSRRGFLGTMAAALVGAASTFDPLRGLWVPQTSAIAPVVIDGLEELNDLALRFAKQMVERMGDTRARQLRQLVLPEVRYELVPGETGRPILQTAELDGHVKALTTRLRLEDETGRGHFSRARRVVKAMPITERNADDYLSVMATQTVHELRALNADMFVPMTKELRPGVPFTDSLVTVVGDPDTGLSVRACRFTQVDGQVLTSMELGAGQWHRAGDHISMRYKKQWYIN